jgi:hypothetical protein
MGQSPGEDSELGYPDSSTQISWSQAVGRFTSHQANKREGIL